MEQVSSVYYQAIARTHKEWLIILHTIIIIIIIVIIIIIIFFMQGVYTYIPETNDVPRE